MGSPRRRRPSSTSSPLPPLSSRARRWPWSPAFSPAAPTRASSSARLGSSRATRSSTGHAPRPLRCVERSGENRSISASSSASVISRLPFGLQVPVSVRLRCRRRQEHRVLDRSHSLHYAGLGMTSGLKICSLLPSATEIVFALGRGDKLVAVTHECDFPPEAARLPVITRSTLDHRTHGSREIHNHISSAVHAGSSIYALDQDLLERLNPDLILTQELCDVCAVSYDVVEKAVHRLDGHRLILSLEPTSLGGILETVEQVGEATE